ncbi:hypothetical protein HG530_011423 [Fusarium avenaceum]|nr:hypothetical protein HG530_011423 [Fusarium avenaceum]
MVINVSVCSIHRNSLYVSYIFIWVFFLYTANYLRRARDAGAGAGSNASSSEISSSLISTALLCVPLFCDCEKFSVVCRVLLVAARDVVALALLLVAAARRVFGGGGAGSSSDSITTSSSSSSLSSNALRPRPLAGAFLAGALVDAAFVFHCVFVILCHELVHSVAKRSLRKDLERLCRQEVLHQILDLDHVISTIKGFEGCCWVGGICLAYSMSVDFVRKGAFFQRLVIGLNCLPICVGLLNHLLDNFYQPSGHLLTVILLLIESLEALVLREDEFSCDKRAHGLEWELVNLEVFTRHTHNSNVLLNSLTWHQRRCNG